MGFWKSGYESSWRERVISRSLSIFFFVTPFIFNHSHPSLALWLSDNRKTVQLFFVSSWRYLQLQQQYFILWKHIPSFILSDLEKTAHSARYKKIKKPKRKSGHKTCKKPTAVAPNLPTTHLFRIQILNKAVTKNTPKISFMKQFLTVPSKELPTTVYIFSHRFIFYNS